ncbi:hypothetical protein LIER_10692 [Lithospermum erythrorhizon]|uniref:Uncharacterized protein n=1 Tax=Lithospermum erythrorhizon TaxID=34254 RepID=A0AAV3PK62_LITER
MASSSKTIKQWKNEREILSQQIQDLELKVQQLSSESSSSITTPSIEGILNEFYTLGLQLFEAKSKEDFFTQTPIISKALINISPNLQNEASSDDDGLVKVKPKCKKGPQSRSVDAMVKKVFDLYKPPEGNLKYLQENFAPIRVETPPTTNITVTKGHIPSDLNGIMLRNGPDAQFDPEGHYNWYNR